jgi:hypothetical protein
VKRLRQRGVNGVTVAMRREARKAVADAERIDRDLEATARLLAPLLPQIKAVLRRRRREDEARRAADIRARLLGEHRHQGAFDQFLDLVPVHPPGAHPALPVQTHVGRALPPHRRAATRAPDDP